MAAFTLALSVASLFTGASAQTSTERVWSSVAFIYHGERLPLQTYRNPTLTTWGAQQMLATGELFRARYVSPDSVFPDSLRGVTSPATIQGLQANTIDNTQLSVLTNTDNYMGPSAQAFMQGFYPPRSQSMASTAGGMDAMELANGTYINYPLDGYQYAKIQTLSSQDPSSTWIQGHADCPNFIAATDQMDKSATTALLSREHYLFYQQMYSKFFWGAKFSQQEMNIQNAYRLYDFALFNRTHENATAQIITNAEIEKLAYLAQIQEANVNTDNTVAGVPSTKVRAIAGRMLAGKVASLVRDTVANDGRQGKLSLMFGAHQPFLAFFGLSGLTTGNTRGEFNQLPGHGAAMVFELFTVGSTPSIIFGIPTFPRRSDIKVRFLYRSSADPSEPLTEHPLFGRGNQDRHIPLDEFLQSMDNIAINSTVDWCNTCNSTAIFCGRSSIGSSAAAAASESSWPINPTMAGVLGAVVTFVFLSLLALAAVFLGGVRFTRRGGEAASQRDSTGSGSFFGGGFKGPEKKQDDQDVAYARGGARHERVGSWELRGGGGAGAGQIGQAIGGDEHVPGKSGAGASIVPTSSLDAAVSPITPRMRPIDDDAISEFYSTPVRPRESV